MRIIGGLYGGRRITPPGSLPVRPTTDIAREALFNLLRTRADLETSYVLDLFSGTGFVSYEFCSRGASRVTAIEQDRACVAFIKNTIDILGLKNMMVIRNDVFRFLKQPSLKADIIFADPPYDLPVMNDLPDIILSSSKTSDDGLIIIEHGPRIDFSGHHCFTETRNYGKVHFSFFNP